MEARRAQAGVRSLELVAPDAGGAALEPAVEASLCACLLTMCPRLDALTLTGCYAADRVVATLPLRRPFALRRLRLRQPAGSGAVHAQLLCDARLASAAPVQRTTGKRLTETALVRGCSQRRPCAFCMPCMCTPPAAGCAPAGGGGGRACGRPMRRGPELASMCR
jgi:hypothetical protein